MPTRWLTLSDYLLNQAVTESARRSTVQLTESFARVAASGAPSDRRPALVELLNLGEVPLKLYLTLIMMTAKPAAEGGPRPLHRETAPSHFAEMLGYDDLAEGTKPPGSGTRRVQRAMNALEQHGYIELTKQSGHHPKIAVVHPAGQMVAPYITLPIEFWKNGWIVALSARALAVYLALRLMAGGRKKQGEGLHVSPYDRSRFRLSDDTWQRGTKDLRTEGLLETRTGIVETRGLRSRHRNVYYLNFDRVILDRPSDPVEPIRPPTKPWDPDGPPSLTPWG